MRLESNKPLYLQLEASIKHDIYSKKYKPGEKLPTEVELGKIYGVSKIRFPCRAYKRERYFCFSKKRKNSFRRKFRF